LFCPIQKAKNEQEKKLLLHLLNHNVFSPKQQAEITVQDIKKT